MEDHNQNQLHTKVDTLVSAILLIKYCYFFPFLISNVFGCMDGNSVFSSFKYCKSVVVIPLKFHLVQINPLTN
jgi:hypothetical protein